MSKKARVFIYAPLIIRIECVSGGCRGLKSFRTSSSQEIKDKGTIGRGLVVGKYLLFYSLDVPRHEVFGVFFNAYDT